MSAVYNLSDLYVGDVLIFKKGKLSLFPHKVIVGVEEDLVGAFLRSKEERHQNIWFYTYYLFPHFSSFGQVLGLYEKEKISKQEGCYLTHLEPLYPYFNQQAPDFAHQALLQSSFITDNELFSCYVKLRELERNSDSIVFENQPIIDYLHYKLGFLEGRAVRLSEKSGVHLQFSDTEFSFDNFYQLGFHASYHYYQYHPADRRYFYGHDTGLPDLYTDFPAGMHSSGNEHHPLWHYDDLQSVYRNHHTSYGNYLVCRC